MIRLFSYSFILLLFACNVDKEGKYPDITFTEDKNGLTSLDSEKYPLILEAIDLSKEGRFQSALEKYDEAEIKYGQIENIYLNRGATLFQMGKPEDAIVSLSRCLTINNENVAALINRGMAYIVVDQFEKALDDLNKAIDLHPAEPATYLNRSTVFVNMNETSKACKDLETSIHLGLLTTYGERAIPEYLRDLCL